MAQIDNNKSHKKIVKKKSKNYIEDLENRSGKRWYEQIPLFEYDNTSVELKEEDLVNLTKDARKALDTEISKRKTKSSSEQGWLLTALNKGTARDRGNAGAVLVESDPIGNLQALNSLVALCKAANKECLEIIDTLTKLFTSSLLPNDRKLIPLSGRGAEYKALKNSTEINPAVKTKILSFWQFEADLKETFVVFIRNLQASAGIGLEIVKCRIVSCAAEILSKVPEQEQNLLTLLINKLGDPCHKVASKSIYHLSNISYTHPNMSTIIVKETEKFLFRNNLPKKAQHYALCFLGNLGSNVESDVAERLVRICFAFFKGCINTGEVGSRTMSTILSCVRRAIAQVEKRAGDTPVLTDDLQSSMYRLIHAADIKVSLQALGLINQVEQGSEIYSDRFYTALYKRMSDPTLGNVTHGTMAMALHILYKAISSDPQSCRAMSFIKRFLQISLYFPVNFICACLYVVSKILMERKNDKKIIIKDVVEEEPKITNGITLNEEEVTKNMDWLLEDTGDEKYEDVLLEDEDKPIKQKTPTGSAGSWYYVKKDLFENVEIKIEDDEDNKDKVFNIKKTGGSKKPVTSYDPYHRNPSFAGGEFVLNHELLQFKEHYHPTVKLFADLIIDGKPVEYTGDPLIDFTSSKFLERFSFKNPKQITETNIVFKNKQYVRAGARNKAVHNLNDKNVTEEERFIFEFLQRRRENGYKKKSEKKDDDDSDVESVTSSIGDDEFDDYLDRLAGSSKDKNDLDFMEEVGDNLKSSKKSKKNKNDDSDSDSDLGDDNAEDMDDENELSDDMEDEDIEEGGDDENVDDFSDLGSEDDEDLIGDLDDDAEDIEFSDDDMIDEVSTKNKRGKKRKGEDLESLFADADDFAHLLEEAGKSKQKHGSSSAVFNRDKSSDKQLKWEEKRRQGSKNYTGKKFKKRH